MSYTPTEWKTGDIVTAEKLNKMEDGIENAGGTLIIEPTITREGNTTTYSLHTSFNDIKNAFLSGRNIVVQFIIPDSPGYDIYSIRPFVVEEINAVEGDEYGIRFYFETPSGDTCSALPYVTEDPDSDIVIVDGGAH